MGAVWLGLWALCQIGGASPAAATTPPAAAPATPATKAFTRPAPATPATKASTRPAPATPATKAPTELALATPATKAPTELALATPPAAPTATAPATPPAASTATAPATPPAASTATAPAPAAPAQPAQSAQSAPPRAPATLPRGGFGWLILQMILVLLAVCAIAYATLRWGLKRFQAGAAMQAGGMRVVERLGLEPRRAIYLVEVGRRYFLVGASEGGMVLLGEVDADTAAEIERRRGTTPTRTFREVLFGRKKG